MASMKGKGQTRAKSASKAKSKSVASSAGVNMRKPGVAKSGGGKLGGMKGV